MESKKLFFRNCENIIFFLIVFLIFLPNIFSYSLYKTFGYETFPIALLIIFFLKKNNIENIVFYSSIILFHTILVNYNYLYIEKFLSVLLSIISYPIIFYFFLNLKKFEDLYLSLIIILIFIFVILFFQYFQLFENIFRVFINNFSYTKDNYIRGINLISSEPSKASVSIFYMAITTHYLRKNYIIILLCFFIEIFFIKSLTGLFLWSLFFMTHFLYNKPQRLLLLFLLFVTFISIYTLFNINLSFINYRLEVLLKAIIRFDIAAISQITGWRLFMSIYPYLDLKNNLFGTGILSNYVSFNQFYLRHPELVESSIHIDQLRYLLLNNNLRVAPIFSNLIVSFGLFGIVLIIVIIKNLNKFKISDSYIKLLVLLPLFLFLDIGNYQGMVILGILLNKNFINNN